MQDGLGPSNFTMQTINPEVKNGREATGKLRIVCRPILHRP